MVNGVQQPGRFGAPSRRFVARQARLAETPRRTFGRGRVRASAAQVQAIAQRREASAEQRRDLTELRTREAAITADIESIRADIAAPRAGKGISPPDLRRRLSAISGRTAELTSIRQSISSVQAGVDIDPAKEFTAAQTIGGAQETRRRAELGAERAGERRIELQQTVSRELTPAESRAIFRSKQVTAQQAQRLTPATRRSLGITVGVPTTAPLPPGAIGTGATGGFLFPDASVPGGAVEKFPVATGITGATIFKARRLSPGDLVSGAERARSQTLARLADLPATSTFTDVRREIITGLEPAAVIGPVGAALLGERRARIVSRTAAELIIPETPAEAVALAATAGVGAAVGFGARATGLGARFIGGARLVSGLETVGVLGGVTLTGLFAADVSADISRAATTQERVSAVGRAGREAVAVGVGFGVGQRLFQRTAGFVRTFGLREVAPELIVAPEFARGQTFPAIRRGQRAGELRAEFFSPIAELGEARGIPRAFTATPTVFAPLTTTGRGAAEVPGLFGAPRVSPRFLRIQEDPGFPIGLTGAFDAGTPTAVRLGLRTLEFQPGVTARTRRPVGRFDREFFESIVGTGRAVIPFAKTEKELVVAAQTPIRLVSRPGFFRFDGTRVPIEAFEIAGAPGARPRRGAETLAAVVSRSSSGLRSSAGITPVSIGVLGARGRPSRATPSRAALRLTSIPSSVSRTPSRAAPSRPSRIRDISRSRLPSRPSIPSRPSRPSRAVPSRPSTSIPSSVTTPRRRGRPAPLRPSPRPERKRPPTTLPKFAGAPSVRQAAGFGVQVRRRGEFRTIAAGLTLREAVTRGRRRVTTTLARTFRIITPSAGLPSVSISELVGPGFRRPRRKGERALTFIERRERALSTPGEISEIIRARLPA